MKTVETPKPPQKPLWNWLGIYPLLVTFRHTLRRPITLMYPYEKLQFSDKYRGGFILHDDLCTGCGLCAWICPDECIDMVKAESGKRRPQVNIEKCMFCGLCVEICPTEAIQENDTVELSEFDRRRLVNTPEMMFKAAEEFKLKKASKEPLEAVGDERVYPTAERPFKVVKPRSEVGAEEVPLVAVKKKK